MPSSQFYLGGVTNTKEGGTTSHDRAAAVTVTSVSVMTSSKDNISTLQTSILLSKANKRHHAFLTEIDCCAASPTHVTFNSIPFVRLTSIEKQTLGKGGTGCKIVSNIVLLCFTNKNLPE